MKKKMAVLAATLMCGSMMAGPGSFNWPGSFGSDQIPCPAPGLFYSNQERTTYLGARTKLNEVNVLGPVKVSRSITLVCLLFGRGDTPYYKLIADAKKQYPDADEIVNVEIVARTKNIFVFYTRTDVILMGTAIKYKK